MKKIAMIIVLLAKMVVNSFSQEVVRLAKYAGNLKKMDVTIDGKRYAFLFDSGAGVTLISPAVASALGRTPYGRSVGFRMTGEKFIYQKCDRVKIKIGDKEISHDTVGVFDLMSFLPAGLPRVDGVISLKSFQNEIISVDLGASQLILENRKSALKKQKHMTPLTSRFSTGQSGGDLDVFLGAKRDNKLFWFLFDSGNLDQVRISSQTAAEWELQNEPAIGATQKAELFFGPKADAAEVQVSDIIYDGALNYDYISKKIFLLDIIKKQVWMN